MPLRKQKVDVTEEQKILLMKLRRAYTVELHEDIIATLGENQTTGVISAILAESCHPCKESHNIVCDISKVLLPLLVQQKIDFLEKRRNELLGIRIRASDLPSHLRHSAIVQQENNIAASFCINYAAALKQEQLAFRRLLDNIQVASGESV